MHILFLESHPIWIYGLPNGFKKLGHHVKILAPNKRIEPIIKQFKPDLIIAIGFTRANNSPERRRRIAQLVRKAGAPYIYWSTEDPGYTNACSLPMIRSTKPDFVFSIHRPTVKLLRKKGIAAAHLDFGCDPDTHHKVAPVKEYRGDAAIVANGYYKLYREKPYHYRFRSLRRLVNPFLKKGLKVDLYGKEWNQMKRIFAASVHPNHIRGHLPYLEAIKVYNSVDFVIGPQNADDRLTQRTYEILASGGLLITDDTPEVRRWFRPGKELLVSSSEKETRKLIDKYRKFPARRKQIRRNAIRAAGAYSYQNRALYILKTLKKHSII